MGAKSTTVTGSYTVDWYVQSLLPRLLLLYEEAPGTQRKLFRPAVVVCLMRLHVHRQHGKPISHHHIFFLLAATMT